MTGIEKAIEKAGGVTALADFLGVSRQAVHQWKEQGFVPTHRVVEIETEYGVDRRELIDPNLRDLLEPPFNKE